MEVRIIPEKVRNARKIKTRFENICERGDKTIYIIHANIFQMYFCILPFEAKKEKKENLLTPGRFQVTHRNYPLQATLLREWEFIWYMSFPSNEGKSHRYNHDIFTLVFGIFLSKCIGINEDIWGTLYT